jgi:outer membrane scaffolding protein for murein synthesis (MipA/OmpV family)
MQLPRPGCATAATLIAIGSPAALHAQDQLTPPTAASERRPLFELGIAAGGAWRPDYPASDQSSLSGIAVPFLILRSELLRSDESGARGRLLRSDWGELSFSAAAAFPSRSENNTAREGMPDLGWLGEVGPMLRLNLWRDTAQRRRAILDLPVRAAFAVDTDSLSVTSRGIVFAPELAYEQVDLVVPRSRLRLSLGPVFGTERFLDYFYEVGPEFARPGRGAYDASDGYLGSRLEVSYRMPITGRVSVVLGSRVEGFWGASNAGSPLFRRDVNLSVAAGFSWSLYRSERTVDATAEPFD